MDIGDFNFKTDFDKQCGEIFLTIKGNMMFHCTLCERIFKDFDEYADHVTQAHILEPIKEEIIVGLDPLMPAYDDCPIYSDESSCKTENLSSEKKNIDQLDGITVPTTMMEVDYSALGSSVISLKPKKEEEYKRNLDKKHVDKNFNTPKRRRRKRITNNNSSERIHKCSLCDFSCNDKSNLISHERRHSAEKPHQCPECLKGFYTRTELKTHQRMHTGERPFLCTICGRSFKTSGILTDHIKRHQNIRSKECDICGKKFYNKDMLRKHLATHSDERPYKCNICDAAFKQANGLRNHKKIHENKREYQCSICSASFNQKPGLHSHMKSKHSFNPVLNIYVDHETTNKWSKG